MIDYLSIYVSIFLCTFLWALNAQNPCDSLPPSLNGTGFVNDNSSCEAYWSCVLGNAYAANCPAGFSFWTNPENIIECKKEPDTPEYPFICKICPNQGVIAVS